MTAIADYVKLNIPETFTALTAPDEGALDGRTDPAIVTSAVASTLSRLSLTQAAIDALGDKAEFVSSYIADLVTRICIPAGIDHWQTKTRLQESTTLPTGMTPGGGETTTYYDKVNGLLEIDALLAARIAANAAAFADAMGGTTDAPSGAFGVSSTRDEQLAQFPFEAWDKIQADEVVLAGISTLVIVRE